MWQVFTRILPTGLWRLWHFILPILQIPTHRKWPFPLNINEFPHDPIFPVGAKTLLFTLKRYFHRVSITAHEIVCRNAAPSGRHGGGHRHGRNTQG